MSGQTVLIVDDDKDVLRGLSLRLKAYGYNVVFAADGISAISMAREEEPEVIILDLGLPAGDGFSVMERLASLPPVANIPIVVLTARDVSNNKDRAVNAGAKAFLQKPVDNDELLATIKKVLGENGKHNEGKEIAAEKGRTYMSGQKILIVDDDKDVLRGLGVRLEAYGFNVVFATDGISAISTARKEEPEVIILDLGLPAGDGFSVMERLTSLLPVADIPIIILTARDISGNKERALQAGAQAFLQKPVDNDVLLETIRKVLLDNYKDGEGKRINMQKEKINVNGQNILETVRTELWDKKRQLQQNPPAI
jgi:DNA-binding response OmpR family regulator